MSKGKFAILLPLSVGLLSALIVFQALILSGNGETQDTGRRVDRATRILVMGRDHSKKLTDSLFLVTLKEDEQAASILQIPRDTYFEYTSRDYKKINGALATLGENELLRLLSGALQVKIHYFVIMDLDGLDRLVNSIGGVDIESPCEMHYSDPSQGLEIHIPKGEVHLDGKQAEQFVRYREGYADADLGRLDAQKLFLIAFARKVQGLTATETVKAIASALTSVQTNIDLPTAWHLAMTLQGYQIEELVIETTVGQAVTGNSGASYYVLNREGCMRQINTLLLPETFINEENFDPDGLFDREDLARFHNIYQAPEAEIPLLLDA